MLRGKSKSKRDNYGHQCWGLLASGEDALCRKWSYCRVKSERKLVWNKPEKAGKFPKIPKWSHEKPISLLSFCVTIIYQIHLPLSGLKLWKWKSDNILFLYSLLHSFFSSQQTTEPENIYLILSSYHKVFPLEANSRVSMVYRGSYIFPKRKFGCESSSPNIWHI